MKESVKKMKGHISIILMLLMAFMLPIQAYAESLSATTDQSSTQSVSQQSTSSSDPQIVSEIPSKNTANTRYFAMSDGTFMAAQYGEPVNYKDSNGNRQHYDNTLSETSASPDITDPSDTVPATEPATTPATDITATEAATNSSTADQTELVTSPQRQAANSGDQSKTEFKNRSSDKDIRLAETSKDNNMIKITSGGDKISWGYENANKVQSEVQAAQQQDLKGNDKFLTAINLTKTTLYSDIYNNVDLQCVVNPTGVKENIILKSADAQNEFTVQYLIGKLTAKQKDDKTIVLTDSKGKTVYTISAPMMTDANGVVSDAVSLSIVSNKGSKLMVEVKADSKWIKDSKRDFPINIDPTVQVGINDNEVYSAPICSLLPNDVYQNEYYSTSVGQKSSTNQWRSLFKINSLPVLNPGDVITNASLNLTQRADLGGSVTGSMQLKAHNITSTWTSADATWNSIKYDSTVLDYSLINNTSTNPAFNITSLVKSWYNGSQNNGILVDSDAEGSQINNCCDFWAFGSINKVSRPIFNLTYKNYLGAASHVSESHASGDYGTGSIDDYVGNLSIVQPILSQTGESSAVDVNFYYNSLNCNQIINQGARIGRGWCANFNKRLENPSDILIQQGYSFVLYNDDGRTDYFKPKTGTTNVFINEFNPDQVILISNNYYILTQNGGNNSVTFESPENGGKIIEETDSQNLITHYNYITYSNGEKVLDTITDNNNATAAKISYILNLTTNKTQISKITRSDNCEIKFSYAGDSNNNLVKIDFPGQTPSTVLSTNFTYDANNRLTSSIKADNSKVCYNYFDTNYNKNRVSKTYDVDINGVSGNSFTFAYGTDNTTKITDLNGKTETYIFDENGEVINVMNSDGTVANSSYNSNGKQNTISASESSEKYIKNYMRDSSAESSSLYNIATWDSSAAGTFAYDTNSAYLGSSSLKITNTGSTQFSNWYTQTNLIAPTSLSATTPFTLSAYVKTSNVTASATNGGAVLRVEYLNGGGVVLATTTSPVGLTGTNDWQRISLTGIGPVGAAYARVDFGVYNAQGTAWFDCMQLEQASCMNSYNAVLNSDFSSTTNWTMTNTDTSDNFSGNGSVTFTGNYTKDKYVTQRININKSNVAFDLLGTVKANSVPILDDSRFLGMKVGINYSDGGNEIIPCAFSQSNTSQQSNMFQVFPQDSSRKISSIDIICNYKNNSNSMIIYNTMLKLVDFDNSDPVADPNVIIDESKPRYNLITSSDGITKTTGMIFSNDTLDATQPYMQTKTTKNPSGFVTSTTDERGKTTTYNGISNARYGDIWTSIQYPKGNTVNHSYSVETGQLNNISATNSDNGSIINNFSFDKNFNLTGISRTGTNANNSSYSQNYVNTYDSWGNLLNQKVGSRTYSSKTWNPNNGLINQITFGNGKAMKYVYDSQNRVTDINDETSTNRVHYDYNDIGKLVKTTDKITGVTTEYTYSTDGTLLCERFTGNGKDGYITYTEKDSKKTATTCFAGTTNTYTISNNTIQNSETYDNGTFASVYQQDYFGRISSISTGFSAGVSGSSEFPIQATYNYVAGVGDSGSKATSNLVESITYNKTSGQIAKYTNTYDDNGNILTTCENSNPVITYTYDNFNQLTSAKNTVDKTLTVYSYDVGGNIKNVTVKNLDTSGNVISTKSSIDYAYGDTDWQDKLTNYNNQSISYDAMGNPTTYRDGMTFTWQNGRELKTLTSGTTSVSYTYSSENGIRNDKNVNGSITKYIYDSDNKLTALIMPNGKLAQFFYGKDGTVSSMNYRGFYYFFVKDVQGNIIKILDQSGAIVTNYSYDAWGKVSITDSTGSTNLTALNPGMISPFAFKGYVYDKESGLYYLNSRYYDPNTGRFINQDDFDAAVKVDISANGNYNMFAYCSNNPITNSDPSGYTDKDLETHARNLDGNKNLAAQGLQNTKMYIKGNTVTIDAYFSYTSNKYNVNSILSGISKQWTGKFNVYGYDINVSTHTYIVNDSGKNSIKVNAVRAATSDGTLTIKNGSIGNTTSWSPWYPDSAFQMDFWTYGMNLSGCQADGAHEFGHVMGIADLYLCSKSIRDKWDYKDGKYSIMETLNRVDPINVVRNQEMHRGIVAWVTGKWQNWS
ncbi:MAG: RHS repeat-associated core domain-containing protein [Bacillota bacterium]|nr:RHS repeat-associated core domain-containing protein [Bacillota bacterium]